MADREGGLANTAPELGGALLDALENADLREVVRRLLQLGTWHVSVGLPRALDGAFGASLARSRTCVLAEAVPAGGTCALLLGHEDAAALIDRMLGGSGRVGVAGKLGAPSDAECGVLAYLAARVGAALRCFRVLDVEVRDDAMSAFPDAVRWPLGLRSAELTLDFDLLLNGVVPLERVAVELVVADTLDEGALEELQHGDLLVSDDWPLMVTTRGLEGTVRLRVKGCEEQCSAQLQGTSFRATSSVRGGPTGRAELVLGTITLSFAELARVVGGEVHTIAPDALGSAVLRVTGHDVVSGRLVRYAGGVALQVEQLLDHSMR